MKAGQYIYAKLTAATAVTDLVGTRIYPVFLPQNAEYPAIVYLVDNEPHTVTKDTPADLDIARVKFHFWASAAQGENGYQSVEDIDYAVREALDFVGGTAGTVTVELCHYDGSKDGRDDEMTLFMREASYTFITKN